MPPLRALIASLDELLGRVPESPTEAEARRIGIDRAMAHLRTLEVDADSLIRFGFASTLAGHVISGLLIGASLRKEHASAADWFNAEHWAKLFQIPHEVLGEWLLEEPTPQRVEVIDSHLSRAFPAVLQWMHYAPLAKVIDVVAPSVAELEAAKAHPSVEETVLEQYTWIVERNTEPDLRKWDTASLHREYALVNASDGPITGSPLIQDSMVEPASLNSEIAARAVQGAHRRFSPDEELLFQIQAHAQTLLRSDRHREASALFDFYAKNHPEDATAWNNAAFCKLPVNPEEAHHGLLVAERKGFAPLAVLVHNIACCLAILNREGEALDRLEFYWHRELEDYPVPATLWRQENGNWAIYGERDARLAVCDAGIELSSSLGLQDRMPKWVDRKSSLEDPQS